MEFEKMCMLAAGMFAALALTLLVWPGLVFWLFGIAHGGSGAFMGRRAAMLFVGLAVVLWSCRRVGPGVAQRGISLGICAAMGGLAVLGTAEWLRGAAGIGIFVAVAVELGLVAGFARVWRA